MTSAPPQDCEQLSLKLSEATKELEKALKQLEEKDQEIKKVSEANEASHQKLEEASAQASLLQEADEKRSSKESKECNLQGDEKAPAAELSQSPEALQDDKNLVMPETPSNLNPVAVKTEGDEIFSVKQMLCLTRQQQDSLKRMLESRSSLQKEAKTESPDQLDGKGPPIKARLQPLGNYFEFYPSASLEKRLLITAGLPKGDALSWHEANRSEAQARSSLREAIKKRYNPDSAKQLARDEMRRLRQTGSISSCSESFDRLTWKIDDMSLAVKKDKCLSGLQPEIKKELITKVKECHPIAKMQADAIGKSSPAQVTPTPLRNPGLNAMGRQSPTSPPSCQRPPNPQGCLGAQQRVGVKRLGFITPELRALLMSESRPFCCRKAGHNKSECRARARALANPSSSRDNGLRQDNNQGSGLRQGNN